MDNTTQQQTYQKPLPEGIGGWLILPVIGFIITPIKIAYSILTEYIPLYQKSGILGMQLANMILVEMLLSCLIGFLAIVTLIFLLQKSKLTPILAISYFILNLLSVVVSFLMFKGITSGPDLILMLVRNIAIATVWIPYFIISKRVKNTFIR